MSFKRQGFSEVLLEEDLSTESLVDHVTRVYNGRKAYIQTMRMSPVGNGVDNIVKVIDEVCKADT
jgi:UDP-N-acetylglucosamine--N-acetylmuramyl-(pentapeptide) pyrophosphoryl-undecaprenol N-acetylglucosamine transferase